MDRRPALDGVAEAAAAFGGLAGAAVWPLAD